MFLKSHKFCFAIKDVENLLVLRTWHAAFFVLPVANRLVLVLGNYSKITPNQVTFSAFALRISSAILFFNQYYGFGAFFFYLAYVLDCVDGPLARLTGQTSEAGRYLDHVSDLIGDILILTALSWSQNLFFTPMVMGILFMHIAESYISYVSNFAIKNHDAQLKIVLFEKFNTYRQWWFKKHFKSFISFPDYTAFVFILMPLLGVPVQGLKVGFYLLFIIVCCTIFSTFVSINSDENRFP